MVLSYSHGASAVPLLGQTIGENLAETVRRFPDAEALVVCHQGIRRTYRELAAGNGESFQRGVTRCVHAPASVSCASHSAAMDLRSILPFALRGNGPLRAPMRAGTM